jgi:hypothetical protein
VGRTANPIPVPESSVGKLAARLRTGLARKGFEQEVTDPAKLDIDHMVPLAEAWDSK